MKRQNHSSISAHLIRRASVVLLLVAVCIIPFARGQRGFADKAATRVSGNAESQRSQFINAHGALPIAPKLSRIAPFLLNAPIGVICPSTITESTSQSIVSLNSVACSSDNGVTTTENHYWRAVNMNTFTNGQEYDITSIDFGIEQATSGTGTGQPITVNLYTNHGSPFPGGDWQSNLIATSGPINVPDQSATIFNVPIIATVPAGTLELVMEVMSEDGTNIGNAFFVSSNPLAETGTSYLSAAGCDLNDPMPVGDIGFPNMHIVFNVNGSCPAGSPTPTPTATATSTATGTATPTATASTTATPRATPSPRPRPTPVPRPTPPSVSPTPTATATSTPSPSGTGTPTASPSPSGTGTPTASPSPSGTGTPTASPSPSGTGTPSASPSPSSTGTPTASPSPSGTGTPTASPTPSPGAASSGKRKANVTSRQLLSPFDSQIRDRTTFELE